MSSTYKGLDTDPPFTATLVFKNVKGDVVAPDDIPVWTVNNENVVTIVTTPDGTEATFTVGSAGGATAQAVSIDKDGTKLIAVGTIIITASGEAVTSEIDFPASAAVPVVVPSDPTQPSTSAQPLTGATGLSTDGSTAGAIPADTGAAGEGQSSPQAGDAPGSVEGSGAAPVAAVPPTTSTSDSAPVSDSGSTETASTPTSSEPVVDPTTSPAPDLGSSTAPGAPGTSSTSPAPSTSGDGGASSNAAPVSTAAATS